MAHSVKDSLLAAFRYLLKPLVRMAVKNAVSFPEFSMALKQAYVDVAIHQLRTSEKSVTAEGISVLANIGTVEIEAILGTASARPFELELQDQSPLPRALAAWHTDSAFSGPYGVLRDLEFENRGPQPKESVPTFSDLVAKYCKGVPARALLDELLRTGCVEDIGNGFYRAISRSYVPDPLSNEGIRHVARTVHNICETLQVNNRPESKGGKGLVERVVYTRHGLSAKNMAAFDSYLRARVQLFNNDIDDWLTNNQEASSHDRSIKTGVGVYHYIVNEEDERAFSQELPIEGD